MGGGGSAAGEGEGPEAEALIDALTLWMLSLPAAWVASRPGPVGPLMVKLLWSFDSKPSWRNARPTWTPSRLRSYSAKRRRRSERTRIARRQRRRQTRLR